MSSPQTQQVGRRLSQRRGSMAAPDPFGHHDTPNAASGSSRITIVRVPSVKDNTPPSPGVVPRDSASVVRRSSWGSNKSGGSDGGGGTGRGRMSFAFGGFTPISSGTSGPALLDRGGAATPTSSGPPSPNFRIKSRSNSSGSMAAPVVPRVATLTPQQLFEAAQQAIHPSQGNSSTQKYGYGGEILPPTSAAHAVSVQAAPFVPLPTEVYLPFINRPQEVTQLLASPQTSRLFALLASTFPQENPGSTISRPASAMSIRTTGGTSTTSRNISDIPEDPKSWTFSQVSFWLRHVTRQEANDVDWIHKLRICINSRSEVLWQRFAGALGVPPGFEEEHEEFAVDDEDDFGVDDDGRVSGVGKTDHSIGRSRSNEAAVDLDEDAGGLGLDEDSLGDEMGALGLDDDDDFDPDSLPGSEAVIEAITASSLPPPPSAASLISPPAHSPGDPHALDDLREEDEEPETEATPGTTDPILAGSGAKYGYHLGSGHKDYVPRSPSPLAASTSATEAQKPHLSVTTPSLDSVTNPPLEDVYPGGEIDFPAEPDPNAEPIQGIRIMNAPMTLFPNSRVNMMMEDEAMISSPAQFGPSHAADLPSSSPQTRQRTGSSSSRFNPIARFGSHQRTQSFGAYGMQARRRSNSSTSHAGSTVAFDTGNGTPHFPGSFAGLGAGSSNPMLLRNPRGPALRKPAGIPIGAGMHYTPRPGLGQARTQALARRVGLGGSAVSLTSDVGESK